MKIVVLALICLGLLLLILPFGYSTLGFCCFFLAFLFVIFKRHKLFASVLAIFLTLFLFIEIPILKNARTDVPADVDYIIVLGAAVNGTTPSQSLLDRLETASAFLHVHPSCKAVVSGGQGSDEELPEAQVMLDYLISQGISSDRILVEPTASNTEENISYSLELIYKETTTPTVAVVSSEYHLYRAKTIGERLGYHLYGIAAPTSNVLLKINYFMREAFAMIKVYLT